MATYRDIQDYIRDRYGFAAQSCWIAHVKELSGLPIRHAPNRQQRGQRVKPCPTDKVAPIQEALRHFGVL
jgi:hypothetical protein